MRCLFSGISSAYNLKLNLNKREFLADIKSRNFKNSTLRQICEDLFIATQVAGLSDKRAQLITQRGTSLHPLSDKLIEDLPDCISSKKNVRRVMYKSRKRSAEYLKKKLSDIDVPVSSLPLFLYHSLPKTRTHLFCNKLLSTLNPLLKLCTHLFLNTLNPLLKLCTHLFLNKLLSTLNQIMPGLPLRCYLLH